MFKKQSENPKFQNPFSFTVLCCCWPSFTHLQSHLLFFFSLHSSLLGVITHFIFLQSSLPFFFNHLLQSSQVSIHEHNIIFFNRQFQYFLGIFFDFVLCPVYIWVFCGIIFNMLNKRINFRIKLKRVSKKIIKMAE